MTTAAPSPATMPVDKIHVQEGFNVRRNGGAIDELAASIDLLGVLVPLIVTPDGELIAGHRRLAAAKLAGLAEVPVHIQTKTDHDAMAAAENIVRQQLTPAEEADAIQRMLDHGYSIDGAAQALAMPRARVTRRLVLLQLPADLRELWGPAAAGGQPSLDAAAIAVKVLEKIPAFAPIMLKGHHFTLGGVTSGAERRADLHIDGLSRSPGAYLRRLWHACDGDKWSKIKGMPKWPADIVLIPAGQWIDKNALDLLDLPDLAKRQSALIDRAYKAGIYGERMTLRPADMDAARAAGVTLQFDGDDDDAEELVFDRGWLAEHLTEVTLPAFEKSLEGKIKRAAKKRAAGDGGKAATLPDGTPAPDPEKRIRDLEREAAKRWRSEGEARNRDLGIALLDRLSTVQITPELARLFAIQSLGQRPEKGGGSDFYMRERPGARLAAAGLRYVMPGWQTEKPKPTKADPDKTIVEYMPMEEAERKLWAWFDQAQTPEEIFGRAIIIHAAARWAFEEVLPRSSRTMAGHGNRSGRTVLTSESARLLEKIATSQIPPAVRKLVREIERFDARQLAAEDQQPASVDDGPVK